MNKARLIITALRTEKLTQKDTAKRSIRLPHNKTTVIMPVETLKVRVVNHKTGELIGELTLDPAKGLPAPGVEKYPETVGSGYSDVLRHHMAVPVGFEPTVDFHPHNFSRVAPSAARTRYRE